MHPTTSSLVAIGIACVAIAVVVAITTSFAIVAKRDNRGSPIVLGGAAVAWLALSGALGAAGVLRRWDLRPPPMVPLAIVSLVGAALLARSRIGERLARRLPLAALVGFQAFRLPLELVMHAAAQEGTMPVQMSFAGANFDILTGASAIVVAGLAARGAISAKLVYAWNLLGLTLLATIVTIAVVSTPIIAAFGPSRLNTWIGWFPFVWMIAINVPAALFGHLVLLRRLSSECVHAANK